MFAFLDISDRPKDFKGFLSVKLCRLITNDSHERKQEIHDLL